MDIRIGIIGCGRISHAHGIAMHRIGRDPGFAACMDVNEEAAHRFADTFGCNKVYADAGEMLAREDLDGVIIATWPAAHRDNVLQAIDAGVQHVLCEKALAPTGEEAFEIWNAARKAGATVVEGFMYLYHPVIARLDELVAAGESGPVDSIRASFHNPTPEPADAPTWRHRKETLGSTPYDRTCYPINICARYARSLPVAVAATTALGARYGTVVRIYGQITYENGCVAWVESSDHAVFGQEVQITCAQRIYRLATPFTLPGHGTIFEYGASRFSHPTEVQHPVTSPLVTDGDLPTYYAYTPQLESFLEVSLGESRPRLPLIASAVNAYTLEALVRSGETGQAVRLELPDAVREAWLETQEQADAAGGG